MSRQILPTGHQGIFLNGVAWLIASSATFQGIVGAANATAALLKVPMEADDTEETGSSRPRAIVHPSSRFTLHKRALDLYQPAGAVIVSFEFLPSAGIEAEGSGLTTREDRYADEITNFLNQLDGILSDCMAAQGAGNGYLEGQSQVAIQGIELLDGPGAVFEDRAEGQAGETPAYFMAAVYAFIWEG
ncbi:MAG: hypothetical protein KGL35_32055 [Bradyrhizobium sp.]|nr:hypothetical protein [Bradyrhizobium sp.]